MNNATGVAYWYCMTAGERGAQSGRMLQCECNELYRRAGLAGPWIGSFGGRRGAIHGGIRVMDRYRVTNRDGLRRRVLQQRFLIRVKVGIVPVQYSDALLVHYVTPYSLSSGSVFLRKTSRARATVTVVCSSTRACDGGAGRGFHYGSMMMVAIAGVIAPLTLGCEWDCGRATVLFMKEFGGWKTWTGKISEGSQIECNYLHCIWANSWIAYILPQSAE